MTWEELIDRLVLLVGLQRSFDNQRHTPVGFYYEERFGEWDPPESKEAAEAEDRRRGIAA